MELMDRIGGACMYLATALAGTLAFRNMNSREGFIVFLFLFFLWILALRFYRSQEARQHEE